MSGRVLAGSRQRAAIGSRRGERAFGLGLALGAFGLALATGYVARRAQREAAKGLVDWRRAEQIAVTRLRRAPGALRAAELAAAAKSYERAMHEVVPLLEEHLEQRLPGVVERFEVVDRAGWARANLDTFEQLIDRLEHHLVPPVEQNSLAGDVARMANRFVTTQQVGFLLGYLGLRVLGQYDIALLSAEAKPGRLLFVEENIRATAHSLGVPLEDFRVWIALHEATHAFEFEANDWLRPYLRDRLERQLAGVLDQARSLQTEGLGSLVRQLRRGDNPLTSLMSAEQRRLFRETQLVMSLLEGFSDWVMDEAGEQLLPNVADIRRRFEARRSQSRRGFDRIIARLTGLDLKLEQYRRGEQFVSGVAAAGGRPAIRQLWAGPWALPSEAELEDPASWVRRVAPQTLRVDG